MPRIKPLTFTGSGVRPLTAREGQKLTGQFTRPVRGLAGVVGELAYPLVCNPFADQLQVPADDGQKIVEVMGYAAGELAHGVHFLGLNEGGPGPFPVRRSPASTGRWRGPGLVSALRSGLRGCC